MQPVQAIFFDLDGTLLDYDDTAYERTRAHVAASIARTYPQVDVQRLLDAHGAVNNLLWQANASVVRSPSGASDGRAIWLETWREALGRCGCLEDAAAILALELYESHRHSSYRLYDDVIELLESLKGRVPMGLITNGPSDTQRDKLRVTGIEPYFDVILVSGEIGVGKPDPEIFRLALERLAVSAAATWHVGDNARLDIAGAQNAGLMSVWLNREGALLDTSLPAPHHEIASLRELLALLG